MRTIVSMVVLLAASVALFATSSGLVAIPSTDIQPKGIWHLGVDSVVFLAGDAGPAPLVDFGMTYGVHDRVEVGMDLLSGTEDPLYFNAKVLVLTPEQSPVALAAGAFNIGANRPQDSSIYYAVASSTFSGSGDAPGVLDGLRLTVGGYLAKKATLGEDNSGIMLGLDRTMGRYWVGVDYLSGNNGLGSGNLGVGYAISDSVGVIIGYNRFNDRDAVGAKDAVNFQFDWNM